MYYKMLHDHSVRSGTAQNLQLLILQYVTHSAKPPRLLELVALVDFAANYIKMDLSIPKIKSARDTKEAQYQVSTSPAQGASREEGSYPVPSGSS